MAKDKDNKPKEAVVVDVDNISKIVKKEGTASVEITKAVMESIQKSKNERIQSTVTEKVLRSEYQRKLKLLQLRKRRKENEITLKYLKQAEILQYQMSGFLLNEDHIAKMGGKDGKLEIEVVEYEDGEAKKVKQTFTLDKKAEETWVPASITTVEYDELAEKMKVDERNEKDALERDYDRDKKNLEVQYPGYFSYSWNW